MKLKRKHLERTGLAALLLLIVIGLFSIIIDKPQAGEHSYQDLYVCAMHPWEISDEPGTCDLCGMNLSQVHGYQAGDPLPAEADLYISPDDPLQVHLGPGTDPQTGEKLIPITQSPYYQPRQDAAKKHSKTSTAPETASSSGLWTCGMHPDVIQDEPGNCPICGMNLTPIRVPSTSTNSPGERRIAYWVAPMDPNFISDHPGKSPMGMDLVPVYDDELRAGVVKIDPATLQSIGVTTETAAYRQLSHEIRTNGTVQIAEDRQARVNARISGWVEKLYIGRTGDHVTKGQKLLEIYSPELVAAQEEFLLALQSAETVRSGSAQSIVTNAENLVQAAQRRLELWNIGADQIQQIRETGQVQRTLALVSPMDGIVLHKNVIEGDRISQGMNLFLIVDLNEVWVEAQVYDYELPFIAKGDAAIISSTYDPGFQYKGVIDYIYPVLDNKTRSITVRLVVPNSSLQLMPNMYVAAELQPELHEQSLSVPKSAVIRSGKEDLVFVALGDGRFEPSRVHLGVESDQFYEISAGLQAGEQVVTSAQFLLDSEANLQEAIQRRLQKRSSSTSSDQMPPGHVQ